jgi:hypothetical protein
MMVDMVTFRAIGGMPPVGTSARTRREVLVVPRDAVDA